MKKILFLFSVTFFLFSLALTILSLAGYDVEAMLPYIKLNYIGVFLVIFLVLYNVTVMELNYPKPFQYMIGFLTLFAIFGFIISFGAGNPVISHGKYYFADRAQWISITKAEYMRSRTLNFLFHSSRWMMFYGISAIICFLELRKKDSIKPGNMYL